MKSHMSWAASCCLVIALAVAPGASAAGADEFAYGCPVGGSATWQIHTTNPLATLPANADYAYVHFTGPGTCAAVHGSAGTGGTSVDPWTVTVIDSYTERFELDGVSALGGGVFASKVSWTSEPWDATGAITVGDTVLTGDVVYEWNRTDHDSRTMTRSFVASYAGPCGSDCREYRGSYVQTEQQSNVS